MISQNRNVTNIKHIYITPIACVDFFYKQRFLSVTKRNNNQLIIYPRSIQHANVYNKHSP